MVSVAAPDPRPVSHILVFEPDAEGHPREWLEHMAAFVAAAPCPLAVTFVVSAEMGAHLEGRSPVVASERIRVVPLRPTERWLCTRRFLTLAAFARWWVMRRYLRLTGAEAGHFLSFDHMCVPLALGLGMGGKPVSGILFRPSVHYAALGPYRPSRRERLRDLRKSLLYRLTLMNRSVRTVLSLDPYFPHHAQRHYGGGDKVVAIPDPAYPVLTEGGHGRPDTASATTRIGFVLFGYLTERKGLLVLLDALARVDPDVAPRIAVTIAGRIEEGLKQKVDEGVQRVRERRPDLHLTVDDRWVPIGELDGMVRASDVVLAPYQRFIGSSGVLLWAARTGLPVLTQDFGLLGRLARDHGLGLTVDTTRPDCLAGAMARMVAEGPRAFIDTAATRSFVGDQTPQRFASAIVGSLQPAVREQRARETSYAP